MNRGELVSRERRAIWLLILLLLFAVALGLGLWVANGASGPPTPVISPIGLPKDVTSQRSAHFMFSVARPVTFECALDAQPFTTCGANVAGSKGYPGPLPLGQHTFKVRAMLGHRTSPAATYSWFIVRSPRQTPSQGPGQPSGSPGGGPSSSDSGGGSSWSGSGSSSGGTSNGGSSGGGASGGSSGGVTSGGGTPPPAGSGQPPPPPPPPSEPGGMPFSISGSASGLGPGATKVIVLRLANPNSVSIHVTRVTVAVSAESSKPGCSSANLVLHQATGISSAAPVTVPAGGNVVVTTFPRAPKIGFRNLRSNQGACKNAMFRLMYTGSAHS